MAQALSYSYTKSRKDFGRQPMFCMVQEHFLDSIVPDKSEQKKYILRNPVHTEVQNTVKQNEHYINTIRVTHENSGINHAEGGWPKEINYLDEEMTTRHRRRVERDDTYIDAVLGTNKRLTKCINQNNAIEMYDMFFRGMAPIQPVEKTEIRLNNIYRDKENRPINCLCWTIEDEPKLVVAYCDTRYPVTGPRNKNFTCAVWNMENPNEPSNLLSPPTACWQAICSPANPALVIGGLEDGRVCIFDIRSQQEPEVISPAHLAHRDPVTSLVYMQSRLNIEFFSGSTDGTCKWWDVRNLSDYIDYFSMSARIPPGEVPNIANAEPVTSLQYEKSFPTKFICGTDTGLMININRKGKTHKEMVTAVCEAHRGPVKAVHRSPCVTKMLLTCGDWTAHIWSEEISISPIVTGIPSRYKINDVAWAPLRLSCYMSVSADGVFRYWDMLRKYHKPSKSLKLCNNPLLKVKPQEEGKIIAAGDTKGNVYVIAMSESLAFSSEVDKHLMVQLYERENRREHILESRIKEIRLKQATVAEKGVGTDEEVVEDEATVLRNAEDEYRKAVADEIRRTGYTPAYSGRAAGKKRK